jgi:hypothetical protein
LYTLIKGTILLLFSCFFVQENPNKLYHQEIDSLIVINDDTIHLKITPDSIGLFSEDLSINTYYYKTNETLLFPSFQNGDSLKNLLIGKTWGGFIGPFFNQKDTIFEYFSSRKVGTRGDFFYELSQLKNLAIEKSMVKNFKRIIIPIYYKKEVDELTSINYQDNLLFDNLDFIVKLKKRFLIIDLRKNIVFSYYWSS